MEFRSVRLINLYSKHKVTNCTRTVPVRELVSTEASAPLIWEVRQKTTTQVPSLKSPVAICEILGRKRSACTLNDICRLSNAFEKLTQCNRVLLFKNSKIFWTWNFRTYPFLKQKWKSGKFSQKTRSTVSTYLEKSLWEPLFAQCRPEYATFLLAVLSVLA